MMKKLLSLALASVFVVNVGTAQTKQPCSTDEQHHGLLQKHPQLAEFEEQFNRQLAAKFAAKTTSGVDTQFYDLPIVVHIVHDYGTENLKDDEIFDAVASWKEAFLKQNADTAAVIEPFKKYIGNARINLRLATIDPQGNPTKGIVRHHSYLTFTASDQAKYESWPNNKYLNIWFINSFGTSGAAAYAYYPSTAAFIPQYDGVISLASYIDNTKTIPHEIGHCLNLRHVWGNNNNAAVACGDDLVDDTPPTRGHTPGCVPSAIYDVTCATGYFKTYVSMSGLADSVVDYPDTTNAQNIMDYTYCANMFSIGQCYRMRQALTSSTAGRSNLITASNLAATGALASRPDLPPVADFTYNRAVGGGSITDQKSQFLTFNNVASFSFRNASWNDTITSVNWSFSNGATNPTSTSSTTVTNKFTIPGWVSVSLTATSNAGANTLVRPNAVYAADTTPVGTLGFNQNFAAATDISTWPMINYYNNDFKWEFYNGAGRGDNACVRFKSYDASSKDYGTPVGDYDDFFTPAFNLEGITGDLYVNFFTTGATVSGGTSSERVLDSMSIEVSTTGGARWFRIGTIAGTDLANNGNRGANFVPNATTAWRGRSFRIDPTYRTRNTFVRLRYRPGNVGNNLYVDNFSIDALPTDIQEVVAANANQLTIFPNPSANGTNLVFTTGNDGLVNYEIRDVAGKLIAKQTRNVGVNTQMNEFISRESLPAAGVYMVTLINGSYTTVQKMVVY